MPSGSRCPDCRKTALVDGQCPACGYRPPRRADPSSSSRRPHPERIGPPTCDEDGAPLTARMLCEAAHAYPLAYRQPVRLADGTTQTSVMVLACPFSCPHCRARLDWSGACHACRGSSPGGDRETWTYPGDRYELDRGHWLLVAEGPRAVIPVGGVQTLVRQTIARLWQPVTSTGAFLRGVGSARAESAEDPGPTRERSEP